MARNFIDITPSPRILQMLGEIDMPVHGCLAELIDNSIDAFLDASTSGEKVHDPRITISFPKEPEFKLVIEDNARGMSLSQLEKSLRAGYTSKARYTSKAVVHSS